MLKELDYLKIPVKGSKGDLMLMIVPQSSNDKVFEESVPLKASKNVGDDKKTVFTLAKRLLFEIPEAYQHEKEYYLLLSELKHAVSRLSTIKGYIPSQEAELALSLYLAAIKLQQNVDTAASRLCLAIEKLQDTSLLKRRAQLYLAVLSGDSDLMATVQARFEAMKSQPLSLNQRLLLEEFESITGSGPNDRWS